MGNNKRSPGWAAAFSILAAVAICAAAAAVAEVCVLPAPAGAQVGATNFIILKHNPNSRLGREFVELAITKPLGFTRTYQISAEVGGDTYYPHAFPSGQVPADTQRVLIPVPCNSDVNISFQPAGRLLERAQAKTGPCVDLPNIYDGDNDLARRLCHRFPGCPASLVFLMPVVAGIVVFSLTRHPALTLAVGAGVYVTLGALLMPNPFIFVFFVLMMGASVLIWRLVR